MLWNVAILALIPGLALTAAPAKAAKLASPAEPAHAVSAASAVKPVNAGTPTSAARSAKDTDPPPGLRMVVSETAERIPLPHLHGPVVVSTDALARRVRVVPSTKDSVAALAAQISKHAGAVCPRVAVRGGAVEMTCRSARFEVQLTRQGNESYLDINELRGLPWRSGADAPPAYFYDPWKIGLGQGCPGKSPGPRGECALQDGHQLEAAIQFRAALETTARQLACVRLGDLAVTTGDPLTGAGWYRRAGTYGYLGRIAEARLCELDGRCLQTTEEVMRAFDTAGLPEPLRAESLMRAARAEAYMGRSRSAVQIISRQANAHGIGSICREGGEMLCRRILLEGMRAAAGSQDPIAVIANHNVRAVPHAGAAEIGARGDGSALGKEEREYLENVLETYLAIPSWEKGPLAVEMAQAAAAISVRLGAPVFGGNLLASLAPEVPDAQLSDHLLLAAETFVVGENWPRARIVAEYAQSRLTGKDGSKGHGRGHDGVGQSLQGPRWTAVYRALSLHADQDDISSEMRAAIEAEFTATLQELKKARGTMDKVEGLLAGAGAARTSATNKPGAKPSAGAATAPLPAAATPSGKPTAEKPTAVAKNSESNR